MKQYVVALDLGTTGNRAIAFDDNGHVAYKAYYELTQIYPQAGWVEHNPEEILDTTLKAFQDLLQIIPAEQIQSIGITNQRETTILWNKKTGKPVYNAIVWQCRRTIDICQQYQDEAAIIKNKTGLPLDPYFSATKIKWLMDNVPGLKNDIENNLILFGTVDSWILWNLTEGHVHATDHGNASRTMLYNLQTNTYDPELLDLFKIPGSILPEIKDSNALFGYTDQSLLNARIPIQAILGDQQASLFAQSAGEEFTVKNTYGTGLFVMMHTADQIPKEHQLINTVAWSINGSINYALEGSIFIGGSALQWLRDGLHLLASTPQSSEMASSINSTEGVYFIPALAGLGAPFWNQQATGTFGGLTLGSTDKHLVRAVLESLAFQTQAVVDEFQRALPHVNIKIMRVDGGVTDNPFLMQFQANLSQCIIEKPKHTDITAFGVAALAGLSSNFWSQDQLKALIPIETSYHPQEKNSHIQTIYNQWLSHIKKINE